MSFDAPHTIVSTLAPISSPTPKGEWTAVLSPGKNERWVLMFGAGASYAADKSLSLDAGFLKSQAEKVEKKPFLHRALTILYRGNWREESLESAWSEIDDNYNNSKVTLTTPDVRWIFDKLEQLAHSEQSQNVNYYRWYRDSHRRFSPAKHLFMFAGWELRNLVADTYSNTGMDYQIHQYLYTKISNKALTLVSLNYDLIAENALRGSWFYAVIEERKCEDAVPVLKPHGSVNWIHEIPLDGATDRIFCPDRRSASGFGFTEDLFRQPSVIGLVRTKREFGPDEESLAVRYLYGRLLNELGRVIGSATHILVAGCSFAPGDQHIQATLSSARQKRNAGLPLKVWYIGEAEKDEREEKKKRWRARLEQIFGAPPVDVNLDGFSKDSINNVMDKMSS